MPSRLCVLLALITCVPALAAHVASADPAAQLGAAVDAQAAASADRAVAESIAREDAAIQSAIDRALEARVAAALGPVPVRVGAVMPATRPTETAWRSRRVLYAVK
jgi:hypothetical protein